MFFFRSQILFRTKRELELLFYLSRTVFQYLTLDYMTKTLNQFFFPPSKSEYLFSNIGNQNIFFRKKTCPPPPPPPWKLNGPSLMNDTDVERTAVLGFKFTKCFDLQRFVFLIEIMFN